MEQRHDRVKDLHRKSRTLINNLQETSKRVKDEISLLHSQSSSFNNLLIWKNPDYWRMRNDSGGVGGTLCSEYFHSDDRNRAERYVSKATSGKIVIPSKGHSESKSVHRKAVKACYCYQDSSKTKLCTKKSMDQPFFPYDYCKGNFNVESFLPNVKATNSLVSVSPLLNGEARRRVERITYSPTSEFLRRVQKKFSSQKKPNSSNSEFSVTSSRQSARLTRDSGRGESAVEVRCRGGKNVYERGKRAEVTSTSDTRADYEFQPRVVERRSFIVNNEGCEGVRKVDDKKYENIIRKPRSLLRKTIRSAECLKDDQRRKQRPFTKHSPKRIVRTISPHKRCCGHDDFDNFESRRRVYRDICDCEIRDNPEDHCCGTTWQLSQNTKDRIAAIIGDNEDKFRELNKFREDNYFDTHGYHTLVASSRSSGSLEQYVLNDRPFHEAVGRIRRDDLMVTMPPCATKQRKRIHYFPRHIVKQDKRISNINYNRKKGRSQSCGFTDHAVDRGILKKPSEIPNNLALRHRIRKA